jgi:hypothetical protein
MIPAPVFTPALQAGRVMDEDTRATCARTGMIGVLDEFATNSRVWGTSRWADGLSGIDQAAALVRAGWVLNDGFGPNNDACVGALLTACANWLRQRKCCCIRITKWREAAILELYWRVAWCYSCDNYVKRARHLIQNLAQNVAAPVTLTDPANPANTEGNPYVFAGSGYHHGPMPTAVALRGDTRDPATIGQDGFQPIDLGRWTYQPWFAGSATGTTPSITDQQALAIEAPCGAKGYPPGPAPAWLAATILLVVGNATQVRGYVYELGNLGNAASARLILDQNGLPATPGEEHVFLAIPSACITRWWAVLSQPHRHTIGPFPFPAQANAPANVNLSAAGSQLA